MLKISVLNETDQAIDLQLEGKLIGRWVDELSRLSQDALAQGKSISLDMQRVWFVDARGATLLRNLAGQQVLQNNCSPFVSQQVKETGL